MNKEELSFKFNNISTPSQEDIKNIIKKDLNIKLDSYLKSQKFIKRDSHMLIKIYLEKTKKGQFNGNINFKSNGVNYFYKNKLPYGSLKNLIDNSTTHLKEFLSKKLKIDQLKKRKSKIKRNKQLKCLENNLYI